MTTLAQAVTTTTQKTWGLSAPLASTTTHLQVESEIVAVTNLTTRQSMFVAENPLQCRVKRGEAGTTAATHAQGATVTELIDPNFGGAGGGVSVTDGTITVEASQIQLPPGTVTDQGAGVAGAVLPPVNLVGTDPSTTPLSVQAAPSQSAPVLAVLDENAVAVASISPTGSFSFGGGASGVGMTSTGSLSIKDGNGDPMISGGGTGANRNVGYGASGGVNIRHQDASGFDFLSVSANAEPPDAFIFRGSCWLWFDKTEGAPKLMLKGKDQGDNIVTAAIPLA